MVEILSASTRKRDQQLKRSLYDRMGVREYWLVDPELNAVSVYRRDTKGSFPLIATLSTAGHDTLETPLLPGWSVELPRLFR